MVRNIGNKEDNRGKNSDDGEKSDDSNVPHHGVIECIPPLRDGIIHDPRSIEHAQG
jgi:hypothetical protein